MINNGAKILQKTIKKKPSTDVSVACKIFV